MESICGTDCCRECKKREQCGGCSETGGHPFGGTCIAAECIREGGCEAFWKQKREVINEVNALGIRDLQIRELHLLNGHDVNLEYPLPNGQRVRFLEDQKVYLGNQVERAGNDRCYGLVADENFLLVCEYGCGGSDPQIIVYRKRV